MTLDPGLWDHLEQHGVTVAHLAMLLRFLQVQRNGSVEWSFVHGQLKMCELRLVLPGSGEAQGVCETVLSEGGSVVR